MYQRILVPLDGSETARRGLKEAIGLAIEQKSTLHLLHVINDFPMLVALTSTAGLEAAADKARLAGDAILAQAQAEVDASHVPCERALREVIEGRAADIIVREAKEARCDLIVMGTHGRGGVRRLALGSDADLVVRHSPVPILLVRHPDTDRR
jgi:nucleotide-binding universal stress UspA family protein